MIFKYNIIFNLNIMNLFLIYYFLLNYEGDHNYINTFLIQCPLLIASFYVKRLYNNYITSFKNKKKIKSTNLF